jgi:hypothetical protein
MLSAFFPGCFHGVGIKIERLLVRHANGKQSFRFLIDLSIDPFGVRAGRPIPVMVSNLGVSDPPPLALLD